MSNFDCPQTYFIVDSSYENLLSRESVHIRVAHRCSFAASKCKLFSGSCVVSGVLAVQVLLELPHIDTGVLDKFRQALATTPGDKEQRALVKKLLTGVGASDVSTKCHLSA